LAAVRRLPDSVGVLRVRDYRLVFGAYASSLLGDGMVGVALAFAVLGLGGSASALGLVLAARSVPLVGCLLVGGVIADRIPRRTVMVAADLTRLASQGTLAGLLIAGGAHVWTLALLSGVTGAATGFFNPASTGLLPQVVAPEQLQQANGLRATAMAVGEIFGPSVAGVLVATAGPGWALGIDAASFAVSAAFLSRLSVRPRPDSRRNTFLSDLRAGWSVFRSRTWLWTVVLAFALSNALWAAWSALGPVVARSSLGGAPAWGAVLSAMGVGGVLGGIAAIRAAPRRPLLLFTLSGVVYAVPLALLALRAPVPILAATALLAGVSLMYGNSVWESTLQRHVPADALSRVSAYDWFGSFAFYPLGLALWGPIASGIGVDAALWLAFALWTAVMLAVLAVPDVRRLENEPTLR
jgi:predicted MFS family arabinose efflux permease